MSRRVGDVLVLDVIGRMRVEGGQHVLRNAITELLGDPQRPIVINLREVPYADTTGIADLVGCHRMIEDQGGLLVLVAVQPYVLRLLEQSGLLGVLTTFADEISAITEVERRVGPPE